MNNTTNINDENNLRNCAIDGNGYLLISGIQPERFDIECQKLANMSGKKVTAYDCDGDEWEFEPAQATIPRATDEQVEQIRACAINETTRCLANGIRLTWNQVDELDDSHTDWLRNRFALVMTTDDSGVTFAPLEPASPD